MPDSRSIPLSELHAQAPFLRRLARALVKDEQGAEDLVQETWVAALERSPGPAETVRGWLARLARNRARSDRRGDQRRRVREARAAGHGASGRAASKRETDVAERVLTAVLSLDEPYRGAVLARYYQDLTPTEIAERAGKPVKTIETRLRRARQELRRRLDGDFGGREIWGLAIAGLAGMHEPARMSVTVAVAAAVAGVCGLAALGWHWTGAKDVGEEGVARVLSAATVDLERKPSQLVPVTGASDWVVPSRTELATDDSAGVDNTSALALDLVPIPGQVAGQIEGTSLLEPWVAAVATDRWSRRIVVASPCRTDGSFVLLIPEDWPTTMDIVAVAQNLAPVARHIDVPRTGRNDVTLELVDPDAVAAGIAADRDSIPMVHAEVTLKRERLRNLFEVGPYRLTQRGAFERAEVRVVTDEYGRFEVSGLSVGRHRALVTPALDARASKAIHLVDETSGRRVELPDARLMLGIEVEELIFEVSGRDGPIDGVQVMHGPRRALGYAKKRFDQEEIERESRIHVTSLPADGRVRVFFDRRAKHALIVARMGYESVTIDPGKAQAGGDGFVHVTLERSLDLPTLLVVVNTLTGKAPDMLSIDLFPRPVERGPWRPPIQRVVPFGGAPFVMEDVPSDTYDVEIRPTEPGVFLGVKTTVTVTPGGANRLEVSLERGGSVRLIPTSDAGRSDGMRLLLTSDEGGTLLLWPRVTTELWSGEAVPFEPEVPAGRYDGVIDRDGVELWKGAIRVRSGEPTNLEVSLGGDE